MAYQYPLAPVGSVFQMTIRMTWLLQELRNTYHFRLEANQNNRSVNVVANAINALAQTPVVGLYATHKALRDNLCNAYGVDIQMISPTRYATVPHVGPGAGDVISVGQDLTFVTATITRRAVIGTRRGVSNLFIPLANSDDLIDDGVLSVAGLAKLTDHTTAILGMITLGDGMTIRPIIYHRDLPAQVDYVEQCTANSIVRCMRRRVVGRGI